MITSRYPAWRSHARPLSVQVWEQAEGEDNNELEYNELNSDKKSAATGAPEMSAVGG